MAHLVESRNERELLSKLNTLKIQLIKSKEQINEALIIIRSTITMMIPQSDRSIIEIIKSEVLNFYNVSADDIEGPSRVGDIMKARHVFCAMGYDKTHASYAQIGSCVNRDHTTVLNSRKTISNYKATNDILYHQYKFIEKRVDEIIKELQIEK